VLSDLKAVKMGSKERIIRQKEETRANILKAARVIVKEEGWQGLSMRKIADKIEYTAPIIYEYFANKEAILQELTCKGFGILTKDLEAARAQSADAAEQLEAMWLAYWNFALQNKEMYQLMYGVEMTCCAQRNTETDAPYAMISNVISELMGGNPEPDVIKQKYFTFFSVIHGLISLNIVGNGLSDEINKQILKDSINGIVRYIKG
jgi:AcrR family transcriptional regulator